MPDGADEKSRGSSSTNRGSSSGVSKTRPSSGETRTSEEGCGRTKKDAHRGTAKNAGDNDQNWSRRTSRSKITKKKVGSATGTALDVAMLLGAADTAHGIPLASCQGHCENPERCEGGGKGRREIHGMFTCGKSRMTRLYDNATDLQGAASQDQAMQVTKRVEQDMEERAKKRETRRRERTI